VDTDEFEIKATGPEMKDRVWTRSTMGAACSIADQAVERLGYKRAEVVNTYGGHRSDVLYSKEATMAEMQTEVQMLELVDGMGVDRAIMVKASPLPICCDPGKHCAHHGEGPFFCCKCAAEFSFADVVEMQKGKKR
jgi:hypothetical protein